MVSKLVSRQIRGYPFFRQHTAISRFTIFFLGPHCILCPTKDFEPIVVLKKLWLDGHWPSPSYLYKSKFYFSQKWSLRWKSWRPMKVGNSVCKPQCVYVCSMQASLSKESLGKPNHNTWQLNHEGEISFFLFSVRFWLLHLLFFSFEAKF